MSNTHYNHRIGLKKNVWPLVIGIPVIVLVSLLVASIPAYYVICHVMVQSQRSE